MRPTDTESALLQQAAAGDRQAFGLRLGVMDQDFGGERLGRGKAEESQDKRDGADHDFPS